MNFPPHRSSWASNFWFNNVASSPFVCSFAWFSSLIRHSLWIIFRAFVNKTAVNFCLFCRFFWRLARLIFVRFQFLGFLSEGSQRAEGKRKFLHDLFGFLLEPDVLMRLGVGDGWGNFPLLAPKRNRKMFSCFLLISLFTFRLEMAFYIRKSFPLRSLIVNWGLNSDFVRFIEH